MNRSAAAAPPRERHRVLGLVCVLSMITYLDRVSFGAAAPSLAAELGLASVADLKWAFTAFAIAYAVFEIPAGRLGDRLGPRRVLVRIVSWWSVCTALTGVIGLSVGGIVLGGVGTLIVLRFLFGAGEAGAYPNITRALHNWHPPLEWPMAQGFVWMSGRVMGGLTPLFWAVLVSGTHWTVPLTTWRGAFMLFGILGFVWCAVFATWFRDHPDPGRPTDAAESQGIDRDRAPWSALLRCRGLWALCLMYACINYGWYFNITYLPSYMKDRYGLDDGSLQGALYKGGPLWVGAAGCLVGGFLASRLGRRFGARGRSGLGVVALTSCASCWLAALWAPNEHGFFLAISAAAFGNDLILGSAWATCQDLGRRHAATTAACMNTVGTFGAATAGWLSGTLVEHALDARATGLGVTVAELPAAAARSGMLTGYQNGFATYAAAYMVAAACWFVIDSSKPIEA